jgi:hypothetical protein
MTISTTIARVDYVGNGVTTEFPVTFAFFGPDELRVVERVIATGVETVRNLTTHYTVTGGNGSTGTVSAVTAPASTVQWSILRATARTQLVDYQANDPFPAETHERALDRVTAIAQEIERDQGRTIRVAETDSTANLTLPSASARANRVLGFNSLGEPAAVVAALGPAIATTFGESLVGSADATAARGILSAPSIRQVQDGTVWWGGTAGGTANALTIALTPALPALVEGMRLRFVTGSSANTGAVTLNPNGLGAAAVQTARGFALVGGELLPGMLVEVQRVGSVWRLVQPYILRDRRVITASTAQVDIVFPAGPTQFRLSYNRVAVATDAASLLFRVSTDSGGSFISGATYTQTELQVNATPSAQVSRVLTSTSGVLAPAIDTAFSGTRVTGQMIFDVGGGGRDFVANVQSSLFRDTFGWTPLAAQTSVAPSGAVNAIRIFASSGNITDGDFALEPVL